MTKRKADAAAGGTQPVQANGTSGLRTGKASKDGVGTIETHGRRGAGESGGGAYPRPSRKRKAEADPGSFLGHGGQSEQGYHGPGQLGDEKV